MRKIMNFPAKVRSGCKLSKRMYYIISFCLRCTRTRYIRDIYCDSRFSLVTKASLQKTISFLLRGNTCKLVANHTGRKLAYSNASGVSVALDGITPPLATPFTPDGKAIDFAAMDFNLSQYEKNDLRGYLICGTNGENILMSTEEKVSLVRHVKSRVASTRLIVAGVNAESVPMALQQCEAMASAGAQLLLVATPSFYKANIHHASLVNYFTQIADRSALPILIYNVPSCTGVDMAAETVIQLAEHKNIIGMKESAADVGKLTRIVHETQKHDFQVVCGSGSLLAPSILMGARGGFVGIANVLPAWSVQLYELLLKNDLPAAQRLQGQLVHPNTLITRVFSAPGMKYAMDLVGLRGGVCRSPLLPLSDAEKQSIRRAFENSHLL